MLITPALQRWRQEDNEFEARLGGYIVRVCLKKPTSQSWAWGAYLYSYLRGKHRLGEPWFQASTGKKLLSKINDSCYQEATGRRIMV
jgi:hypothetical protein